MNIINSIKQTWTTFVHHNPKTLKKLEVLVSDEVPVVKTALEVVLNAYLATKGIVPGSIASVAADAALDVVGSLIVQESNNIANSAVSK